MEDISKATESETSSEPSALIGRRSHVTDRGRHRKKRAVLIARPTTKSGNLQSGYVKSPTQEVTPLVFQFSGSSSSDGTDESSSVQSPTPIERPVLFPDETEDAPKKLPQHFFREPLPPETPTEYRTEAEDSFCDDVCSPVSAASPRFSSYRDFFCAPTTAEKQPATTRMPAMDLLSPTHLRKSNDESICSSDLRDESQTQYSGLTTSGWSESRISSIDDERKSCISGATTVKADNFDPRWGDKSMLSNQDQSSISRASPPASTAKTTSTLDFSPFLNLFSLGSQDTKPQRTPPATKRKDNSLSAAFSSPSASSCTSICSNDSDHSTQFQINAVSDGMAKPKRPNHLLMDELPSSFPSDECPSGLSSLRSRRNSRAVSPKSNSATLMDSSSEESEEDHSSFSNYLDEVDEDDSSSEGEASISKKPSHDKDTPHDKSSDFPEVPMPRSHGSSDVEQQVQLESVMSEQESVQVEIETDEQSLLSAAYNELYKQKQDAMGRINSFSSISTITPYTSSRPGSSLQSMKSVTMSMKSQELEQELAQKSERTGIERSDSAISRELEEELQRKSRLTNASSLSSSTSVDLQQKPSPNHTALKSESPLVCSGISRLSLSSSSESKEFFAPSRDSTVLSERIVVDLEDEAQNNGIETVISTLQEPEIILADLEEAQNNGIETVISTLQEPEIAEQMCENDGDAVDTDHANEQVLPPESSAVLNLSPGRFALLPGMEYDNGEGNVQQQTSSIEDSPDKSDPLAKSNSDRIKSIVPKSPVSNADSSCRSLDKTSRASTPSKCSDQNSTSKNNLQETKDNVPETSSCVTMDSTSDSHREVGLCQTPSRNHDQDETTSETDASNKKSSDDLVLSESYMLQEIEEGGSVCSSVCSSQYSFEGSMLSEKDMETGTQVSSKVEDVPQLQDALNHFTNQSLWETSDIASPDMKNVQLKKKTRRKIMLPIPTLSDLKSSSSISSVPNKGSKAHETQQSMHQPFLEDIARIDSSFDAYIHKLVLSDGSQGPSSPRSALSSPRSQTSCEDASKNISKTESEGALSGAEEEEEENFVFAEADEDYDLLKPPRRRRQGVDGTVLPAVTEVALVSEPMQTPSVKTGETAHGGSEEGNGIVSGESESENSRSVELSTKEVESSTDSVNKQHGSSFATSNVPEVGSSLQSASDDVCSCIDDISKPIFETDTAKILDSKVQTPHPSEAEDDKDICNNDVRTENVNDETTPNMTSEMIGVSKDRPSSLDKAEDREDISKRANASETKNTTETLEPKDQTAKQEEDEGASSSTGSTNVSEVYLSRTSTTETLVCNDETESFADAGEKDVLNTVESMNSAEVKTGGEETTRKPQEGRSKERERNASYTYSRNLGVNADFSEEKKSETISEGESSVDDDKGWDSEIYTQGTYLETETNFPEVIPKDEGRSLLLAISENPEPDAMAFLCRQVSQLMIENNKQRRELAGLRRAQDAKLTPFRDVLDEARKWKEHHTRSEERLEAQNQIIQEIQESTTTALQKAITKSKVLQDELRHCQRKNRLLTKQLEDSDREKRLLEMQLDLTDREQKFQALQSQPSMD